MSGQRSGCGEHRCVTLLYHIPLWIFDCVLDMHDVFVIKEFINVKKRRIYMLYTAI